MKTLILPILSVLIITAFSCKKEESNTTASTSSNDDYFITVKKDGVEYNLNQSILVSYSADALIYYGISGIDTDGNTLELTLKSPTATGTFPTGTDATTWQQVGAQYKELLTKVWSTRYRPGAGTITISQNTSTNMKGSFSFTGINPNDSTVKVFTEGKFNARKL